jgi:hypothetical protein
MYKATIPPISYYTPWDLSFSERMSMLTRGSPRAAYFYSLPDTSTFRYRAYNVAQSLAGTTSRHRPSAAWFTANDFEQMGRVISVCDVLILCRNSLYNNKIAQIAAMARAQGRRILFDIDDLVFDPSYIHLLIDTLGQDMNNQAVWDYWFSYIGRIGATFSLTDGAIVTNNYLAERAEAWSGKPARVLPNFMNKEQLDVSDLIWQAKESTGWSRDNQIHLAYFSGSPSHNRDFSLIAETVADLMDEDERLHLKIVGFLDQNSALIRHESRIQSLPLQDFINLQREIGTVEINLVPLQDNPFTNCKSELKWFEAAVVGALTVASPTQAYQSIIKSGSNGWLASAHLWQQILKTILNEFEDVRGDITARARQEAYDRFGWSQQATRIESALFDEW